MKTNDAPRPRHGRSSGTSPLPESPKGTVMHDSVQAHFEAFETALWATGIAEDRKKLMSQSIRKIADLYPQFQQTNSSRYGDEITRHVQFLLEELEACPDASKLGPDFRSGLNDLHEQIGAPALALKTPKARARKAAKPR
jgi:hypothetical protein